MMERGVKIITEAGRSCLDRHLFWKRNVYAFRARAKRCYAGCPSPF
jgi:hypothetical protein